jgi:spiro-SPASM protein
MCPRDKTNRQTIFMSKNDYNKIIDDISLWCEDAVICISGMGEPFLHPDILELIDYTIHKNGLKLIVETSGLHFSREIADKILKIFNNSLHIIFSCESIDSEHYKKIRGKDNFREVEANIDYYISKQRDNTFISYTKMGETEDCLDAFYERWKNYQERIIIVKYNDFRGEINCTKAGDLSPIKRFPCWHLKRDMYINSLCEAVLCKQDYKGEIVLGNVLRDGAKKCFDAGLDYFKRDYISQNVDYCLNCDEYFTYNF